MQTQHDNRHSLERHANDHFEFELVARRRLVARAARNARCRRLRVDFRARERRVEDRIVAKIVVELVGALVDRNIERLFARFLVFVHAAAKHERAIFTRRVFCLAAHLLESFVCVAKNLLRKVDGGEILAELKRLVFTLCT